MYRARQQATRSKQTTRSKARRPASDTGHGRAARARGPGRRTRRPAAGARRACWPSRCSALTKPRIIVELLVTTVPTMLLARRGLPAVGADRRHPARRHARRGQRQHDQLLHRPRHRRGHEAHLAPAAGGQGERRRPSSRPRPWCSGSCSAPPRPCCSAPLVNWLAAALADAAILFYVFVYTLGLKRRTASNIVIGGAAGCFPVLVGWAAVTGRVACPRSCCSP